MEAESRRRRHFWTDLFYSGQHPVTLKAYVTSELKPKKFIKFVGNGGEKLLKIEASTYFERFNPHVTEAYRPLGYKK